MAGDGPSSDTPPPQRRGITGERPARLLARLRARFDSLPAAIGFAAAAVAAGLVLRWAMGDPGVRFVVLYPAVALAALVAGPIAGLVATILAALAAELLFFRPLWTPWTASFIDTAAFLNFLVTGAIVSLVAAVDLSAAKRMRTTAREGREAEALQRAVVEALEEGVVVFGPDGLVASANPAAERFLGRTAAEMHADFRRATDWPLLDEDGRRLASDAYPVPHVLRTRQPVRGAVTGYDHGDGNVAWFICNTVPLYEEGGDRLRAVVVSFTDITARRRAERELSEGRALLRAILAALNDGVILFGRDGSVHAYNPAAERILGHPAGTLASYPPNFVGWRLFHEDGRPMTEDEYPAVRALSTGTPIHAEVIGVPGDGRMVWLLNNADPIVDPTTGRAETVVVSFADITERRRAETELAESRAHLASIFAAVNEGILVYSPEGYPLSWNPAVTRMLGRTDDELARSRIFDASGALREDGSPLPNAEYPAVRTLRTGASVRNIILGVPSRENRRWLLVNSEPILDPATGEVRAAVVSLVDVSERLKARRALMESEARLASIVSSALDAIVATDAERRIVHFNPAAECLFDLPAAEALGRPLTDIVPERHHGDVAGFFDRLDARTIPLPDRRLFTALRRDGSEVPIEVSVARVEREGGPLYNVTLRDISERLQSEHRLAESDQELRQTLDAAGLGVWWCDLATSIVHCDPRSRVLFAAGEAEPADAVAERFRPDDRAAFRELRERLAGSSTGVSLVLRRSSVEGTTIWLSLTARLRHRADGVEEIWGTVRDETETHRAEEAIRRFEASRRLEAIGRMVGGIAHDLNNLLTVVSGNLQLLEMSPGSDAAGRWVAEALRASESGAALNDRLLTFARRRRLEPALTDLDGLIADMADLLRRSAGPTIRVDTRLAARSALVRVDPAEIENAMLNLVLNARDAMPAGGHIRIETADAPVTAADVPPEEGVRPGDYVRLTVADDGEGMTAEVRARAFEPFFTTKPMGRGSGLGLATLHGFVHQSGGFVVLRSEVGRGTSVDVYLPRGHVRPEDDAERRLAPTHGHGETILVVEDDADVRRVTCERLELLGYRTEAAEGALQARERLARPPAVDLVVSDVVMPAGISGLDLARELRAEVPTRRVLLVSGWAEDVLGTSPTPELEFPLLHKPHSLAELANAVASALKDAPQSPPSEDPAQPRVTSGVKT